MSTCSNCGRQVKDSLFLPTMGICAACRKYELRTGRKRPAVDSLHMSGGSSGFCTNCGERHAVAKRLCRACWLYQHTHGKKRPRRLWMERLHCRNCGAPGSEKRHSIIKGRCNACYRYWRVHGIERLERYWTASRWCDCGQPATHFGVRLRTMSIDKETVREECYDLCSDCYQLEFDSR